MWSAAQVHMAGLLAIDRPRRYLALCISLQDVIPGTETWRRGVLAGRQYCAGARLRAKSACGGTHLKRCLRPRGRPTARFSALFSPAFTTTALAGDMVQFQTRETFTRK